MLESTGGLQARLLNACARWQAACEANSTRRVLHEKRMWASRPARHPQGASSSLMIMKPQHLWEPLAVQALLSRPSVHAASWAGSWQPASHLWTQ